MEKRTFVIPISSEKSLQELGENIKFARLRRNLSMKLVAERAFISRVTLGKIEKGDPSVSIGAYASVLHALGGFDKDLAKVALDETWARTMLELGLSMPKRGGR